MSNIAPPPTRNGFKVAVICALSIEAENVQAVFDRCWDDEGRQYNKTVGDQNEYTTGVIGRYNVVLVHMPGMGNNSASQVAANLRSSYPGIKLVLVIGVCGVAPVHPQTQEEIVLGDIVISTAITQYDFGRRHPKQFRSKRETDDSLGRAVPAIRSLVNRLQTRQNRQRMTTNLVHIVQSGEFREKVSAPDYPGSSQDWLFESSYVHQHRPPAECAECDNSREACSKSCRLLGCEQEKRIIRNRHCHPKTRQLATVSDNLPVIHFGRFGSGNTVMKSGSHRDELVMTDNLAAFEMEGAGVWEQHPTVVIKAACDYADSHKNKAWQEYAAGMAAACLKVFLEECTALDDLSNGNEPRSLGLCLASAPLIQPDLFIGRASEISKIHSMLWPENARLEQRRVVLGGIGGIGKTQLAIAYARQHGSSYTSVLWLNATSEQALHDSFQSVAEQLIESAEIGRLDQDQILAQVRRWLLHPQNTQWLLILDNYDHPDQLNISSFLPSTSFGSIIITTRLPDEVDGESVRIQPLTKVDDSLAILQSRSRRANVKSDPGACALAQRLAGLPIALVTAGAYLCNNDVAFQEYLDAYEQRWRVGRRPLSLREYQDRTLYSTWNLTYSRLETEDPEAAQMLKLLAYFDHQEVWYELFRIGLPDRLPSSLPTSLTDRIDFGDVMGTLVKYCLVEINRVTQSYSMYSMHSCVHDWSLGELSQKIDSQMYWYAFDCVAASIDKGHQTTLGHIRYGRVTRHATRLTQHRFEVCDRLESGLSKRLDKAKWIARLLAQQEQFSAAEHLYLRTLAAVEQTHGCDHVERHNLRNNLGLLYIENGKAKEAEQIYQQALPWYKQECGPNHILTINTINNLGLAYYRQDRLDVAEQMFLHALSVAEAALGLDKELTIDITYNLGLLYTKKGQGKEAEYMYQRALSGYEKVFGPGHITTWQPILFLGGLYLTEGNFEKAEQMYLRALSGYEKAYGPNHTAMAVPITKLGRLYLTQGNLEKAEQMYQRVLSGYVKEFGPGHSATWEPITNLGKIYLAQGSFDRAEQMYLQVLASQEKSLGPDHESVLSTVSDLATVYLEQERLEESEAAHRRVLGACRNDSADALSVSTVYGLAVVLDRVTRSQDYNHAKKQSSLGQLIQHVARWARDNRVVVDILGRSLLRMREDQDASTTYFYALSSLSNDTMEFESIACSGCQKVVTIDNGRFVCRQCENVDLCHDCMARYTSNDLPLTACHAHDFYDVGAAVTQVLDTYSSRRDMEADMRTWLDQLQKKYHIQGV